MARIDIKPISVNEAYRGRRFATKELTQYKSDLGWLLPKMVVPDGPLAAKYVFGVSSKTSDGDNLIKAFQDAIAEHYGFNDKRIYRWDVTKVDVPKGKEFVEFELSTAAAR
jgi:Holliday junction resolvase RusA-like endonuclease